MGAGDCIEKDGSKLYRPPSQMQDYWATNQNDLAAWSSWCYNAGLPTTQRSLKVVKRQILDDNSE